MNVPLGLDPYLPPVSEKLHMSLTLSLLVTGFFMYSWMLVYQLTNKKEDRSFFTEVICAGMISLAWGFASLFGLLWAGLYV